MFCFAVSVVSSSAQVSGEGLDTPRAKEEEVRAARGPRVLQVAVSGPSTTVLVSGSRRQPLALLPSHQPGFMPVHSHRALATPVLRVRFPIQLRAARRLTLS